jgi:hypothetical protein
LLSWFDEPPDDLVRCVASLPRAGIDHVVAVDGPYEDFPHRLVSSPPGQQAAIRAAAYSAGIGLTLHVPRVAWAGNEIAKRTFMHRLALAVTGALDDTGPIWHLVIDADEVIDQAPPDLTARAHWAGARVAEVLCREHGGGEGLRRRLFRALPLHLAERHCNYVGDDGALLSWPESPDEEVPAPAIPEFVIAHRQGIRREERLAQKDLYYQHLPEGGRLTCERCGRPSSQRVRGNFRRLDGDLISDPFDVCQFCADGARAEAATALRGLGINPERVAV